MRLLDKILIENEHLLRPYRKINYCACRQSSVAVFWQTTSSDLPLYKDSLIFSLASVRVAISVGSSWTEDGKTKCSIHLWQIIAIVSITETQSQNAVPCALLLQTNAITKAVKIALITQRKANIEALQPQFYALHLTDKLFYTVSKLKKNLPFPHVIILLSSYTQIMI